MVVGAVRQVVGQPLAAVSAPLPPVRLIDRKTNEVIRQIPPEYVLRMATSPCEAYLESEILSADPIEPVQILCRAALAAVGNARRCLRQGDIASRSKQITRASVILTELTLLVG